MLKGQFPLFVQMDDEGFDQQLHAAVTAAATSLRRFQNAEKEVSLVGTGEVSPIPMEGDEERSFVSSPPQNDVLLLDDDNNNDELQPKQHIPSQEESSIDSTIQIEPSVAFGKNFASRRAVNISNRSISFSPYITVLEPPEVTCWSTDEDSHHENESLEDKQSVRVVAAFIHGTNDDTTADESQRMEKGQRSVDQWEDKHVMELKQLLQPFGCDTSPAHSMEDDSDEAFQINHTPKKGGGKDSVSSVSSVTGFRGAAKQSNSRCSLVLQLGLAVGLGLIVAGCVVHFSKPSKWDV